MFDTSRFSSAQLQAVKKAMVSQDTFATTYRVCFEEMLGENLFTDGSMAEIDTVLLWRLVYDELGVMIPEEGENRLNALVVATQTAGFYTDAEAFGAVCNAFLSGDLPDDIDTVLDDLTLPEMLWGIFETGLNRGDDQEASGEVMAAMLAVLEDHAETDDSGEVAAEDPTGAATGFVDSTKQDLIQQLDETGLPWRKLVWLRELHSPI